MLTAGVFTEEDMASRKRLSALGIVLGVLGLTVVPALAQRDRLAALSRVLPFVVSVEGRDNADRLVARCSGLLLGRGGHVVTLAHAIHGTARQEVVTAAGERHAVRGIAGESVEHDLVLLALKSTKAAGLPLEDAPTTEPEAGKEIVVLGAPSEKGPSLVTGVVTAVRKMPLFGKVFRIDAAVPESALGGPVIDGGGIVGLIATHGLAGSGTSFAIPWEKVMHLWQRNGRGEDSARREGYGTEAVRLYQSGIVLLWEGHYSQAERDFGEATRLAPAWAGAEFLLGYAALEGGRPHVAAESIQRAARLEDANLEVFEQLGQAYGRIRCFQDAAEAFERAIALSPQEFDAYLSVSYAYGRLGWHEKATGALQRAVATRCAGLAPPVRGCLEEQFARLEEMLAAERDHLWTGDIEADLTYQRGLAYLTVARMDLAREAYRSLQKRDSFRAARLERLLRP